MKPDPAAAIVARIASPRVLSINLVGGTVSVTGRASSPGAESARTLWYQTIAGAAYAQKVGVTGVVSRKALTETGALVEESEDPVYTATSGRDWFAPVTYSASEITQGVSARAASVGARVLRTNYISLFGGIAEIILTPENEAEFMAESGHRIAVVLGELGTKRLPYLVTVVDFRLDARLVVGWTPSVGGTIGWGIGWQAPDVQASAIWGF